MVSVSLFPGGGVISGSYCACNYSISFLPLDNALLNYKLVHLRSYVLLF